VRLLHSQRIGGGDKAGLVGLSLTERKAPTRTAREERGSWVRPLPARLHCQPVCASFAPNSRSSSVGDPPHE
jgi:hypothetical protein